ncbi:type II secretion system F family protein [Microbacterium sp.]|uniref:type II secretion system F family protein n=1 Tax=Microbacterium sp. TaxID=51671 RepID=UPI003A86FDB7
MTPGEVSGRAAYDAAPRARRRRVPRPRRSLRVPEGTHEDVAGTVRGLAVMLEAGVAPVRAWHHLAGTGDRVADDVDRAVTAGGSATDVLAARGGGWRQVATAWRIAEIVGAPLAPSLRAIAAAQRDADEARDDVRVALAEPAATARLVAWLPVVAVALAVALGFDIAHTLTHPLGIACLVIGAFLMLAAHRWTRRLVAAAQPAEVVPGLTSELLAIALSGGVSIDRATYVLGEAGGDDVDEPSRRVLALSASAGAPAVELLRAQSQAARQDARTEGRLRAAALSSRLLLPLGVCTLPAFLALGVGPMMLSVLTSTPVPL